jgi:hypothetical protein
MIVNCIDQKHKEATMNYDTDVQTIDKAFRISVQTGNPVDLYKTENRGFSTGSLIQHAREERNIFPPSSEVWGTIYNAGYIELNLDAYKKGLKKEALQSPLPPEVARVQTLKIIDQMKDQINMLFREAKDANIEVRYFGDFMWDAFALADWMCSGNVSRHDKALWEISDCGSHLVRDKEGYDTHLAKYLASLFSHHSLSRSFVIDFVAGTVTRGSLEECANEVERTWKNKR